MRLEMFKESKYKLGKENCQETKIVTAMTALENENKHYSVAKYDTFTYKTYSSDKNAMIYQSAIGQN